MKIAIIGGGWVGCHLAYKLKDNHDVVLYEKNDKLFLETSYNNQNRLHNGYHYARNYRTRNLCESTFEKFNNEYDFLVSDIDKNYYCVPGKKSFIDFETYLQIFKNEERVSDFDILQNIEGCIKTNEKYIDFKKAHTFFNEKLSELFIQEKVTKNKIKKLSKEYDLVINATNNTLKVKKNHDSFFELTISLLYQKINKTQFDALTLVDGDFFSIYPYQLNLFTITDVQYTPIKKFKTKEKALIFAKKIDKIFVEKRKNSIEKKILYYYSDFKNDFIFNDYFLSIKSKYESASDDRYPIIILENNIVNCFTGKIQGIYIIESEIKKIIKNLENDKRRTG